MDIKKLANLKKKAGLSIFPKKMINPSTVGRKIINSNIGKLKRGTLGASPSYNPGTSKSNVSFKIPKPIKAT